MSKKTSIVTSTLVKNSKNALEKMDVNVKSKRDLGITDGNFSKIDTSNEITTDETSNFLNLSKDQKVGLNLTFSSPDNSKSDFKTNQQNDTEFISAEKYLVRSQEATELCEKVIYIIYRLIWDGVQGSSDDAWKVNKKFLSYF